MTRRYIEGTNREQLFLDALCPDDLARDQSIAVVTDEFVNSPDLASLGFSYTAPYATGRTAYNPGDMLKLYIYGYLNRIRSSRRPEAETMRNVDLMWLLKGLKPDDKTISNFRKEADILQQIQDNANESVCTVDPRAKLMKQAGGNGFDICCNVQTAVDDKHGLVTAFEVTDHCNDANMLHTMATQAKEAAGVDEINAPADTGCSNGEQILRSEEDGIRCFIPAANPSRQPKDEAFHRSKFIFDAKTDTVTCPPGNIMPYAGTRTRDGSRVYSNRKACMSCREKPRCIKSKTLREFERSPYTNAVQQAHIRTKTSKELYKKRRMLAEHPFGAIKAIYGYEQFLCTGKEKTSGEAALAFLSFNLRRAINIPGIQKLVDGIREYVMRTTIPRFVG